MRFDGRGEDGAIQKDGDSGPTRNQWKDLRILAKTSKRQARQRLHVTRISLRASSPPEVYTNKRF